METESDLENKLVISVWEREVDRVKERIGNQEAQTTVCTIISCILTTVCTIISCILTTVYTINKLYIVQYRGYSQYFKITQVGYDL